MGEGRNNIDPVNAALDYLQNVAKCFNYAINPDDKALRRVVSYMAENKRRFGNYYCPCKQHYPLDQQVDPVCPCKPFRDEIKRDGHCECHVFFDKTAATSIKNRTGLLATVTCPG